MFNTINRSKILILLLFTALVGCGGGPATVTVQGKIIQECPTGCWFDIQQGGAKLHIDIRPAGLAIPQRVGKTVTVEGQVISKDGQVQVSGRGVEIK